MNDKPGKPNIDERLAAFERDLKRIDRLLAESSRDARQDFDELERSFKDFLDENDIDVEEVKKNATREFERLKKEIEFSASALKSAVHHLRDQYKKRN
jgi:predicted phage-related endonuclease